MKVSLTFFLSILAGTILQAQKIYEYGYDASGNRISRNVVYLSVSNGGGNPGAHEGFAESGVRDSSETNSLAKGIEAGAISFFPNPTTNVVNVHFDNTKTKTEEVRILSGSGQVLYQQKNIMGNFELAFETYAPGTYFIWLKHEGEINRVQVIKE